MRKFKPVAKVNGENKNQSEKTKKVKKFKMNFNFKIKKKESAKQSKESIGGFGKMKKLENPTRKNRLLPKKYMKKKENLEGEVILRKS